VAAQLRRWIVRGGRDKPERAAGSGLARRRALKRRGDAMDLEGYALQIVEFVKTHQAWAAPVVFALCFAESLAFISLLLPAWAALVAIGTLIGASGLNFWPIWIAGSIGAALGDWLSYWVGIKLEKGVYNIWPLSKHPELIPKGEDFVKKWGALAIFIGRFSGPLRATVPLVAGIFAMPFWRFQLANFSSAFVWAAVLLTLGDVTATAIKWVWG
jgi:membrane protein DedA with SNARE-associated domain